MNIVIPYLFATQRDTLGRFHFSRSGSETVVLDLYEELLQELYNYQGNEIQIFYNLDHSYYTVQSKLTCSLLLNGHSTSGVLYHAM